MYILNSEISKRKINYIFSIEQTILQCFDININAFQMKAHIGNDNNDIHTHAHTLIHSRNNVDKNDKQQMEGIKTTNKRIV